MNFLKKGNFMKPQNIETKTQKEKSKYVRPEINQVKLDNEISMVMMSANPYGDPSETSLNPSNFSLNPFKMLKF